MTEAEIFATTALSRDDSKRVAIVLAGAPAFVVSSFQALIKAGCYSTDELIERIDALRSMCR